MRLSFLSAVACLLARQIVVGFSILPTKPTVTKLSATKPKQSEAATSPEAPWADAVQEVLLPLLEKRLQEGPGALSQKEYNEFRVWSDNVLAELRKASGKTSAPPAAAAAAVSTAEIFFPVVEEEEDSFDIDNVVKKLVSEEDGLPTGPEYEQLLSAVASLDSSTVSALKEKGVEMDEATTEAAFWAVVQAVDQAEAQDQPLSADVPRMLHHIFDADLRHLLTRDQTRTNVTCMQPEELGLAGGSRALNYIFDDSTHKDLPLTEGRRCEDGQCCDACSRNIFPTFASEAEIDFETFQGLNTLTFNDLQTTSAATIIQFTRLVERVRRTMAHEYGLPLKTILPLQAYSRKYVAGTTQQGGGGGEGDMVTLHTDEATHAGYHYSCVIYLSTHGEDFEGGAFVFNDPAKKTEGEESEEEEDEVPVLSLEGFDEPLGSLDEVDGIDLAEFAEEDDEYALASLEEEIRRAGRELTPYYPTRGAAVIFSSGWENMHEVEKITKGVRYAVPCFFTTCPVPEAHYDLMVVGKPKTDEDIADDWLHLLLAHRAESPMESTGRVKELFMKWHYMCAPLSEH